MMKYFLAFIAVLCALQGRTQAQSNLAKLYDEQVISPFADNRYIVNNVVLHRRDIKPLLLKYESSAYQYKLFQRRLRLYNAMSIGAAVLYFGSLGLIAEKPQASLGVLGLSVGTSVALIPLRMDAALYLQRAIFLYNREILINACKGAN